MSKTTPETAAPAAITQVRLRRFLALKAQQAAYEKERALLVQDLQAGATVDKGKHSAALKVIAGIRRLTEHELTRICGPDRVAEWKLQCEPRDETRLIVT